MTAQAFSRSEISAAVLFALAIEVGTFALLVVSGTVTGVKPAVEPAERVVPISVLPIVDELPLLKRGGKPDKAKLPDMWKKPQIVKRYKDVSAPSPQAEKTPPATPPSPVAQKEEEAPPPEAELAKEVDENTPETEAQPEEQNLPTEGAADGLEEGTEADPLKARAVDLYRAKIIGWFNRRFHVPVGQIDCATLKGLSARVVASVGGDRSVTSFSVTTPSGNPVFDDRVQQTMAGTIGQQLPPPPQNYPDILESSVSLAFQGNGQPCE